MDLNEIRLDLEEILTDLNEIRPDLKEIRRDLSVKSIENRVIIFRCVSQSGRLKISFSCLTLSTDSPVSGFMGGNQLPIVADIGSVGFRAGSAKLSRFVRFQVYLDTPRHVCCRKHI